MDRDERAETEAFEIEDLEYDVGGAGAVEASETQANHAAAVIYNFGGGYR